MALMRNYGVLLDNIDGVYVGNTNYISYLLYLKRFGNIIIINTIIFLYYTCLNNTQSGWACLPFGLHF